MYLCISFVQAMGRHQESIACYNRSIQLRPDYAIAYGTYGIQGAYWVSFEPSRHDINMTLLLASGKRTSWGLVVMPMGS
jgi:hypothetical protein